LVSDLEAIIPERAVDGLVRGEITWHAPAGSANLCRRDLTPG